MSVVVLNCHSWPIGVSSNVKLPFGIGWGGGSISQTRFGCHVVCTDIQGISAWLPGGSICQSMFICQVWHSGIQGKYSQFRGGVHLPKSVFLPSVVYWYSSTSIVWQMICVLVFRASAKALCCGGSIYQSRLWLPSCVFSYSRHLCSDYLGGNPSGKVCSSVKKVDVYWYSTPSMLSIQWGVHLPKYIPVFYFQVLCTGIQGIYALFGRDPSTKVCSSTKCCVLEFNISMLYSCGGSICQSVFVCQVLCTGIQGIYALFVGGPSTKVGLWTQNGNQNVPQ